MPAQGDRRQLVPADRDACIALTKAGVNASETSCLASSHHARPHFHARYAGRAASVDLDGNVVAGSLPRRAQALVMEWARLHRPELEANWERARREQQLEPVEPLP